MMQLIWRWQKSWRQNYILWTGRFFEMRMVRDSEFNY